MPGASRGPGTHVQNQSPPLRPLPPGILLAWYGDDFTGAAAVMEAMTFAGLPAVLFLDLPQPAQLACFPGVRGIGVAGVARSQNAAWATRELPGFFRALVALGAPVTQYKICSTLDSGPDIGSIGAAIESARPMFGDGWIPLVPAARPINRFQAFGNLFAGAGGAIYRLDRHPTMSRHLTTPMDEADVRRHLARQTVLPIGLVDLNAMKSGLARQQLRDELAAGHRIIALDVVDDDTLAIAGSLIWEDGGERLFAVGSQGIEYALLAHWRRFGFLNRQPPPRSAGPVDRILVASGSVSPLTAAQIAWGEENGFARIAVDAARSVDEASWSNEIERVAGDALNAISGGFDPILSTAAGPDDPRIARTREAIAAAGIDSSEINARIGRGLGVAVDRILRAARIQRVVLAGGDTSSHAARELDVFALTSVAATIPGASLCKAHSDDPALVDLEISLKGAQMGAIDYLRQIKMGGLG
jgi:uncharacterized protein YgbK (DUF1537 family)